MMPSSGKSSCFIGLTDSLGSIYLSVKRCYLETSSLLFFHWYHQTTQVTTDFSFAVILYIPFGFITWNRKLFRVLIQFLFPLTLTDRIADKGVFLYFRPWLQQGLRWQWAWEHHWKDFFCQAGWHFVCLYYTDAVFALASWVLSFSFFKCSY